MKHFRWIVKSYMQRNLFSFIGSMLLCIFAAVLAMLPAKLIQMVIDDGFLKRDMSMLIKLVLALAFAYLSKSAFTFFSNKLLIALGNGMLKEVKAGIYNQLMTMDLSFYTGNDIGYINARVEEVSAIDALFSTQSLSLVSALLEFIFALVILFSFSWKILLMLMLPVPLLVFIVVVVSSKLNKQVKDALNDSAEYAGKVHDTLRGMETVKSQGLEDVEKEKIDNYNRVALDSQKKTVQYDKWFLCGNRIYWFHSYGYFISNRRYLLHKRRADNGFICCAFDLCRQTICSDTDLCKHCCNPSTSNHCIKTCFSILL